MAKKQVWTWFNNRSPTFKNVAGIAVSDVGGASVGLGGLYIAQEIAPEAFKQIENLVGHGLVKCMPGIIHKYGAQFANMSPEEAEKFKQLSNNEQGTIVAKPALELTISGVLSYFSGKALHNMMDKHYGNGYGPEAVNRTRRWDFGVQTVSTVLLNTLGNKYASEWSRMCSKVLQNAFGIEKKRADALGAYFVRFEGPNLLGNVTNLILLPRFGAASGGAIAPRR